MVVAGEAPPNSSSARTGSSLGWVSAIIRNDARLHAVRSFASAPVLRRFPRIVSFSVDSQLYDAGSRGGSAHSRRWKGLLYDTRVARILRRAHSRHRSVAAPFHKPCRAGSRDVTRREHECGTQANRLG